MPAKAKVTAATDIANEIGKPYGLRCRYQFNGRRFVWNFYVGSKKVRTVYYINGVLSAMEHLVKEYSEAHQ